MSKQKVDIIRRVVSLLDSVDYAHYSEGKAKTYLEYVSGTWADERKLIAPIIFPRFIDDILGFTLGENIGTQETAPGGMDYPDYTPVDTRTHPFVFDCKGMDTEDLAKWYNQIRKYVKMLGLRYGILTNMRDMDVYTLESEHEIEAFNCSFVQLYKDYNEDFAGALEKDNTKRFLTFVDRFRFRPLTIAEKFKRVAEAKAWTNEETLNIDLLTRRLHYVVECIHEDAGASKQGLFVLREADPHRANAIAQEIEIIALEIERGTKVTEASPETFEEIMKAAPNSLLGRALDVFLYRVGYFTMTRLLLVRTWEDIGFIDQTLYDGGLAKWYENFNREIRRVLQYAFGLAAERYKWLFNIDNNYTWYDPSDDALIEALYELSNFNLGKLNQDVLGSIYEEYIDKVDKKRKGQYYTPREVIEFIWNRVGFTNPKAFFWHIRGERRPKFIFDPASGSGGFLVEAARRIREESGIDWSDFKDLNDIRFAIVSYIFGAEVSIFPYYITEVNLLIQLTPVVKKMIELRRGFREPLPLGVVPVDALSLYNPEPSLLPEEEYKFDHVRDLLPLESQKKAVFEKIKKRFDGNFSYCCANPPYIGEKGNKELFRYTLQRFPYWKEFYQGKMDYLYFFIILGLSKLRDPGERTPGGKLGFITTSYWPTADGASKLRKFILENAKIKEIIFFENVKIFEYAKGQHNMVFILERFPGKEREAERAKNRIKIVKVLIRHQDIPGDSIRKKLKFLIQHIEKHIHKGTWKDRYLWMFWSALRQGQLPEDGGPWNLVYPETVDQLLRKIENAGVRLDSMCDIVYGLQTSADKVTSNNLKLMSSEDIAKHNIKLGDGIFIVSSSELGRYSLTRNEKRLIKPFIKNSDIARYVIDREQDDLFVIYTGGIDDIGKYPNIKKHLRKFISFLQIRAVRDNENYEWYEPRRPRRPEVFRDEKILVPYRAPHNVFAYAEAGDLFGSIDIRYITKTSKPEIKETLLYLVGLLNSRLLDFWMQHKGKKKGEIREYYYAPLGKMPIRRIDFDDIEEVKIHDDIVHLVVSMRKKVEELSKQSEFFLGPRLTQLMPEDPLPEISYAHVIQSLSPEKRFSVRTHPEIKIAYCRGFNEAEFFLKKCGKVELTIEGPELRLVSKGRKTICLQGPEDLLQIVCLVLERHQNECWESIKEMPIIPETAEDYENTRDYIIEKVSGLRKRIQELQARIDTLVFELYDIPIGVQKTAM